MIIKDLQRNKKNRNFIPYLRKVVESYRAGLVSSTELKTGLQMDFKRVRHLNRWYFKHRILPLLKPKKTKKMKSDNARIKELEAKIKLLEKEKEFFQLKAVAWETLVDVAEETMNISIKKKFAPKRLKY